MENNEIYNEDFYSSESKSSTNCANAIVPIVYELFKPKSIIDIGCGVGSFLNDFSKLGVSKIIGLDGDYVPRNKLLIDEKNFRPTDLTKPYFNNEQYDIVFSLEVAEHIDSKFSDQFIENMCKYGNIVVFSAAIPFQGGDNHINEQWQSYWVKKFLSNNFKPFDIIRPLVWDNDKIDYWYKQNMIVFANDIAISQYPIFKTITSKSPESYDIVSPTIFKHYANLSSHLLNAIENIAQKNKPVIIKKSNGQYTIHEVNV